MDERKRKILQAIIDDYITTAEPVGSRTLARKYNLGVSPATIRNDMFDLELLGYLEQPHTSSGRIPSVQGYRFYVDCLLAPPKIGEQDILLLERWHQAKAHRIEEVFQETAKFLSQLTRNISLALSPQLPQCYFKYLQFLPLDERRVIAVVVTDTGFIENKVMDIPEGTSINDLQGVAERVNNKLSGLLLDRIKFSILEEVRNDIHADAHLYEAALAVLRSAIDSEKKDKVYMGGTSQLLDQPEFRDVEKVKNILLMLEEESLIYDILHMNDSSDLMVTIGQENKIDGIRDCSIIQATYRIEGQVVGSVAVLGPTRMEYGKIIGVMEFMRAHLGDIIKKLGM